MRMLQRAIAQNTIQPNGSSFFVKNIKVEFLLRPAFFYGQNRCLLCWNQGTFLIFFVFVFVK